MAENIKGTNIASPVAPFTTDDAYPTHYAKYGNGGYKEVATITDRDAIPLSRLEDGCIVYVKADNTEYRWIDNAWEVSSIDLSEYVKEDENGNVDIDGNLSVGGKLDVEDVLKAEKGEYNSIISLGNNTIGEQDEPDSWEEGGVTVYDDAYATVVLGDSNESHNAVVLGNYNKTKGYTSVIGNYNDTSLGGGMVVGNNNKLGQYANNCTIVGLNNEAKQRASQSTLLGQFNISNNLGSTLIGTRLTSKKNNQVILGTYNTDDANSTIIIANGTSNTAKHNVITIDSNNAVNIDGSLSITGNLTVTGDIKCNTITIGNTPLNETKLNQLLKLIGYTDEFL